MSKNSKPETSIVTIRIDKELNEHIDRLKDRLGLSKADLRKKTQ